MSIKPAGHKSLKEHRGSKDRAPRISKLKHGISWRASGSFKELQLQKEEQLSTLERISFDDLEMTWRQGDILLTRKRVEIMSGVFTHHKIMHLINASSSGAIYNSSKRISGWDCCHMIVRRKYEADQPLVLSVLADGIELISLKLWLAEHQSLHEEVVLRRIQIPQLDPAGFDEVLSGLVESIVTAIDLAGGSRTNTSSGMVRFDLHWSMMRALQQMEHGKIIPGDDSAGDDGGEMSRVAPIPEELHWLVEYLERLSAILHEPAEGVRTAAKREFFMMDSDDSKSLDMTEVCQLLLRLHTMAGEQIPTERELFDEVAKVWADVGKVHEEPLDYEEFEAFFRVRSAKNKRISEGHDVFGTASGELVAAIYQRVRALPEESGDATALDSKDRFSGVELQSSVTSEKHYSPTSFSTAADFAGERAAIFESGYGLEKEIIIDTNATAVDKSQ